MVKSPAELTEKLDFVVCAHKAINPEATPAALAPVVGDNTTVVIIQNGVGNEEPFRRAFPTNSILTCVVCSFSSTLDRQLDADRRKINRPG